MRMTIAEIAQLRRAEEQANSASTKLDIQWGVRPNREGSRRCQYEGCSLGEDGGPKALDLNNGSGFCRDHWRFSRAQSRRQLALDINEEG